ncbi:MFS general substrate transporter [Calocera viscosa TUFC12733]|uniref:MFS general substrate transporter n=1 Tax=Calocera viscosa (strain TUFC12733) TaxID=1330018 RepID=A0A167K6W0_CALVF|nr:MFS general substrate transporter [Calocera viscosa TUFC12733]
MTSPRPSHIPDPTEPERADAPLPRPLTPTSGTQTTHEKPLLGSDVEHHERASSPSPAVTDPAKPQEHHAHAHGLARGFSRHGDPAAELLGNKRVTVTEEDNRRIARKTDHVILVILCWVYFLQILDKSVIGYSAVFGLQADTGLVGNQYSFVGSVGYIAQLGLQPFSTYLIVTIPPRTLMPAIVFCWGAALTGMAGAHNYGGLVATRFLLGLFEAACLPLFTIITMSWYRRAEQPTRIAAFYSTNGIATIIGSALVFGLGHIQSTTLHSYQIIFLVFGLITVLSSPLILWKLDNGVTSARFLTPEDRLRGVERLRANQQGTGSTEFKWRQVLECFLEPKTYLFVAMTLLLNIGASVTNTFGPLIINGLGFDPYISSLLNMPFGAVQFIVILLSSWAAYSFKNKGYILLAITVPVVVGCGMLFGLGRGTQYQAPLLVAYYLLGFLFGGNPLIVSWIAGNTAGQTKKSTVMAFYQAASSAGNIIGPLMFQSADKPYYYPGLKATLGVFCALFGIVIIQIFNLMFLNKLKEKQRVANGKPAKLRDLSMTKHYVQEDETEGTVEGGDRRQWGANAFADMTDKQNDEFLYVL